MPFGLCDLMLFPQLVGGRRAADKMDLHAHWFGHLLPLNKLNNTVFFGLSLQTQRAQKT